MKQRVASQAKSEPGEARDRILSKVQCDPVEYEEGRAADLAGPDSGTVRRDGYRLMATGRELTSLTPHVALSGSEFKFGAACNHIPRTERVARDQAMP